MAATARPETVRDVWPGPAPVPVPVRAAGSDRAGLPAGLVAASPWRRLAAWTVDSTAGAAAGAAVVWWAGGARVVTAVAHLAVTKRAPADHFGGFDLRPLLHGQPLPAAEAAQLLAVVGAALAVCAAWVAYKVGATARFGTTAGKALFGLRVVRLAAPDAPPGLTAAFTRWVVPQGSGLVPLPGTGLVPYLWVWRDPDRRGLHDRAAGTAVVDRRRSRPA